MLGKMNTLTKALALAALLCVCSVSTFAAPATYTRTVAPLGNGYGIASICDTETSTVSTYLTRSVGGGGICSAFQLGNLFKINGGLIDYGYYSDTDKVHSYNDAVGFNFTFDPTDPDTISVWRNLVAQAGTLTSGITTIGYSGVTESGLLGLRLDGYNGIGGDALGTVSANQEATTIFGNSFTATGFTMLGGGTSANTMTVGSMGEHQYLMVSSDFSKYLGVFRANFTGAGSDLNPHGQYLTDTNKDHRGSPAINDTARVIACVAAKEAGDPTPETDEYFRLRVINYTDDGSATGFSKTSDQTYSFRNIGDGKTYAYANFYDRTAYNGPQQISINDNGDIAFPVVINVHDYDATYTALGGVPKPYRYCPRIGILFMSHLTPGVFKCVVDNLNISQTMFYDPQDNYFNIIGGLAIDNDCNVYFSSYSWAGSWTTGTERTAAIFKASANDAVSPTSWTTEPILWRGCSWKDADNVCSIWYLPVNKSDSQPYYTNSGAFCCDGINRTKLPGKTDARYSVGGLMFAAGVDVSQGTTTVGYDRALYLAPTDQLASAMNIDDAKQSADYEPINLTYCTVTSIGGTYTAPSSGNVYHRYTISQGTDSTILISTIRSDLKVGDRIHVSGNMATNTLLTDPDMAIGDRYIMSSGLVTLCAPVGMANRNVGSGSGLSTVGKWVKIWGTIGNIDTTAKYMDINDGSNKPVRVDYSSYTYALPSMSAGDFVVLTGHVNPGSSKSVKTVNGDELQKS